MATIIGKIRWKRYIYQRNPTGQLEIPSTIFVKKNKKFKIKTNLKNGTVQTRHSIYDIYCRKVVTTGDAYK
jgi:hypothetical protein